MELDRSKLLDHWDDDMPEGERVKKLERWQSYRSCIDCKHYVGDSDGEHSGICDHPKLAKSPASFIAVDDFYCEDNFEPMKTGALL
jgi:hypothetical protein